MTVTYWAWLNMQKVADIFNETQDRIRVEATTIASGPQGGYAKILSAVSAGGGPDIAQVGLRSVPEFALAGALMDLSRYGFAEQEDRYDPGAISQVKVGETAWAVPQDTGPGQNYNEEVIVPMAEGQNLEWTWAPLMQRVIALIGNGTTDVVNGELPMVDMFAEAQSEIVEIMREIGLEAEEAR